MDMNLVIALVIILVIGLAAAKVINDLRNGRHCDYCKGCGKCEGCGACSKSAGSRKDDEDE